MGRAKIEIKLITNEQKRNSTFLKRRKGLKKKTLEFATLCDVDACMICFGPSGESKTWPENRYEVEHIINRYKGLAKEDRQKRKVDLWSFLAEKKMKLEQELVKKVKENVEASYPTWGEGLNELPEESLRKLASLLDAKLDSVRKRVESLKGKQIEVSVHPVPPNQTLVQGMHADIGSGGDDYQPVPISYVKPLDHHQMAMEIPYYPTVLDCGVGLYGHGGVGGWEENANNPSQDFGLFGYVDNSGSQNGGLYVPDVQNRQMYMPHQTPSGVIQSGFTIQAGFNFQGLQLSNYGRMRF